MCNTFNMGIGLVQPFPGSREVLGLNMGESAYNRLLQ